MCVRTLTGLGMLVCSMDGTVAYLDFSLDELGDPLSEEEKVSPPSPLWMILCEEPSELNTLSVFSAPYRTASTRTSTVRVWL